MHSDTLRQQIEEAQARQEAANTALQELDQELDAEAGQETPDHKALAALQKRKAETLSQLDFLARRVVSLEERRREVERTETEERLAEIERENAGRVRQAEGLMSQIAEACTVIQQALSDLKTLLREREVREHEREFLSLKHSIHSSALSRLPVPDHNFLASLERAREGLRIFGTDEWERKTQRLRSEQEAAQRKAGDNERQPGIRTIGQGKHYTTVLRELDEAKARELDRAIVRGPTRLTDLQGGR